MTIDLNTLAPYLSLGAIILGILTVIVHLLLSARMRRFEKAYVSLQTFMSGSALEELLQLNLKKVETMKEDLSEHGTRIDDIENKLRAGVDRVELVRFNSSEHMGAELSFALAMLNQEGNGVVLTSIQSVEECRVYSKSILKGQAAVKLMPEEKLAIERALAGKKV